MPKRKIRVISCIPGSAHLESIVKSFLDGGPGWVTSFSDVRLRTLSSLSKQRSDAVRPYADVVGEYLTRLHVPKLPMAQAGHIRAAVSSACLALPEDSNFAGASRFPGTHRKIASALSELKDWGLDSDSIAELSERSLGTLSQKLRSLSFVEREITDSLRSIARERGFDRIAASLGVVGQDTDLGRLLVVSGSEIANNHLRWLSWASESGAEVVLVVDRSEAGLFRDMSSAVGQLSAEVVEIGAPNALQSSIFRSGKDACPKAGAPLVVRIESSADALAEAEWTLRSVSGDLEGGFDASEVAILCRDSESYMPLLDAASTRLGVRIACSRRLPLLGNSFARFLLGIMQFCCSEDVRTLGPVLRSSYLRLSLTEVEAVEAQLKAAYAQGEDQWDALEGWSKEAEEASKWLASLIEWRSKYLHHPAPLYAWCDRLSELGRQSWHDEALAGTAQTGTRDGYAESAMLRSLAQHATIDRVRGVRMLGINQFVSACRRIWDETDVSALSDPSAVQVVSSALQLGNIKVLYVMGLLEGVFPKRRSVRPNPN